MRERREFDAQHEFETSAALTVSSQSENLRAEAGYPYGTRGSTLTIPGKSVSSSTIMMTR
ncbi:hypothetical protein [Bradyrhizobium liaoningense]|uniref:hypothetical protein n=1 Tax=Bradyrhizobium liaoningense TaxID=43992 RepID=UPI001BA79304|nr:hypothetical protein [Bradyrhizobium liaoningense]MBR0820384.1 hypothetical protein [Bradyrhizobium liaoningense]